MIDLFPPEAFEMFFDERVEVAAARPSGEVRGSFRCCIDHKGSDETLDESSTSADRLAIAVTIPTRGERCWDSFLLGTAPRAGDRVFLDDGSEWAVQRVDGCKGDFAFCLHCRETKRGYAT